MTQEMLNQALLPHNDCFGCGHENPRGLHIELYRNPNNDKGLKGVFRPEKHLNGFPGITHGGALYTALDCMAAWVPTALRPESHAIWILRSANMTYHRPVTPSQEVQLVGVIEEEGKPGEAMRVRTEARNEQGDLLAEGTFKVIPLPADKFQKVTGIPAIPENWKGILGFKSSAEL